MRRSLNGTWTLIAPDGARGEVQVPGCWEAEGHAKDEPGPFWYERLLKVPESMCGRRLWLGFEGVSCHAEVYLESHKIGEHTGAWDAFEFEVTDYLTPGRTSKLRLQVEKPASLMKGPDSDPVPGRFPLKETLAGFLPYVWGQLFGGPWQDVWLEARPDISVEDAFIRANAEGSFEAEIRLTGKTPFDLEVVAPDGEVVARVEGKGREATLTGKVSDARPWNLDDPVLYKARVRIDGEVVHSWPFGFRSFEARGTTLYLNGSPVYPRMALSWGWYQNALHNNPGRKQVRADLLRLKKLGYNGVKLCLWVPPRYYFELADELGLLLWLELPMWLPKVTPFFKQQTPQEYERIICQVRQHPSLIIYSLGCELNREVGAEILGPLYHQTKDLIGEALLRDNSGSGEAYGGLLNEFADYYDYHFYSDIQFFSELIDTFMPRWRPVQPWVFGEFCDLDTFRDLRKLYAAANGEPPWWTSTDPALNPQGARWQYDVPFQEQRLRENGFWERGEELEAISNKQALLHRKFTLELVRTYREIAGYVVTGECDTPISTAGMWDDTGEAKFPPEAFRVCNDDLTLSLGWDKRRAWVNGGDRATYWDTFSYPAGAWVRPHLIASNYSPSDGRGRLAWKAEAGTVFANKEVDVVLASGDVREVAIAEFEMPDVEQPVEVRLEASLVLKNTQTRNTWKLWCFPKAPWRDIAPLSLVDPAGRLRGLEKLTQVSETAVPTKGVAVTTTWNADLERFVGGGGRAVLFMSGSRGDPYATVPLPFWREAVKVFEPHPAWGDFPHNGFTDLQFYGMAADLALDTSCVSGNRPILRRLDARTMAVHDYAAELPVRNGRLIVTTLRFAGGLGNQPTGITRNTAAAYLLSCWVRYLQSG